MEDFRFTVISNDDASEYYAALSLVPAYLLNDPCNWVIAAVDNRNNAICGAVVFERKGTTVTVKYIMVVPCYRRHKIATQLMVYLFSMMEKRDTLCFWKTKYIVDYPASTIDLFVNSLDFLIQRVSLSDRDVYILRY